MQTDDRTPAQALTARQRVALSDGIEVEGFSDYFGQFTTLAYFESKYGPLPQDLADAWRAYDAARCELQSRLAYHGAMGEPT